jgi:hypothetical protein
MSYGVVYKITNTIVNLREFCRNNPELDRAALTKVHKGKANHHKGWRKYT